MNERMLSPEPDAAQEAAAEWCIRLAGGDMTEADWAAFEIWHEQDGNAALLTQASSAWQACEGIASAPEIIPLRTEALTSFHTANRRRWRWSRSRMGVGAMGIAASLAVVGLVSFAMLQQREATYETAVGERRIASLSDGSRLSLDAATELGVTMADGARSVELRQGRALFDVAKDPLRPFTVAAGDKLVVAIGTSFSVELVNGEVQVILYEGQVEVRDRAEPAGGGTKRANRVMLAAGELLTDKLGNAAPAKVVGNIDDSKLAWEDGMLSFEGETLAVAVERMNRHSQVPIRLGDAGLGTIPVDGEFVAGDTDAFVEGLVAIHGLRASTTGREITLQRK